MLVLAGAVGIEVEVGGASLGAELQPIRIEAENINATFFSDLQ